MSQGLKQNEQTILKKRTPYRPKSNHILSFDNKVVLAVASRDCQKSKLHTDGGAEEF